MGCRSRRTQHPQRRHRLTHILFPPRIGIRQRQQPPRTSPRPTPLTYMARPLVSLRLLQPPRRTNPPPGDVPLPELPQHNPDFLSMGPAVPRRRCHLIPQSRCRRDQRCRRNALVLPRAPCHQRGRKSRPNGRIPVPRPGNFVPQRTLRRIRFRGRPAGVDARGGSRRERFLP